MKFLQNSLLLLLGTLALGLAANTARSEDSVPRERLLMDFGWKFHLGNDWGPGVSLAKAGTGFGPASMSFSDASWRSVNLPHDWAVELPFDKRADMSHGFKAIGEAFPQNSIAWYRRTFDLSKNDQGKRIWLQFDGVYRDCDVFVNGWIVGHHNSGYMSFRYDITDVANYGGKNVVAVRVDATQPEGWFYEGAGIYRHVWLVETAPVSVAPDGVFVSSSFKDNVPAGPATINLQTRVANANNAPAEASVSWTILGPDGSAVASATSAATEVAASSSARVRQVAYVTNPQLWSPEHPTLYTLVTTVMSGGETVDRVETVFGIRTVAFDPNRGFLLNGQPYELKGTCNHQDHAGVGSALPDRLQYFRIARLKAMGSNAYRTSHNAPTPELLEACDRLGMLVMDENRLLGSDAANMNRLESQIRRDRNHPSVAIWSIANEEFSVQGTPQGARVATTMQDAVHRLDPTRPITYAAPVGNEYAGINSVIEVRGWNYHPGPDMDAYHKAHPNQPEVGTEQGSTVSTRGIYANDPVRGYVSAYDDNAPEWAQTAETWWTFFDARPWLSGGFVWTGFDYRGEPTPYGWPCINSHFGIMDTCGFPKDNFWYYKSWWGNTTVLHLLPHWNWPGKEGQPIDVRALSNCDEVELFLNGKSLGRKSMKKDSELKWSVPYEPGVLSAIGYRDGNQIAETKVETTGPAAAVALTPDRGTINADGQDVSVITVSVKDAEGRVVPVADNLVTFALDGPGRIIGVGNGDPSCHEPDVYVPVSLSRSVPINGWRWKKGVDVYTPNQPEEGVNFDDSSWATTDVNAATGPLGPREHGVFRVQFNVTASQLASPAVELWFGRISGGGSVYVNGRNIGPTGDSRAASIYDVKALLHPGENTVAVSLDNYGANAGLTNGVALRLQEPPKPVTWKRSVFNGLAEIIVQSRRRPGTLHLTATSPGLKPVTVEITTRDVPLPPAVP